MSSELKKALKGLTKSVTSFSGTVVSVDRSARSCVVQPIEDERPEVYDLMLQGAFGLESGFVLFPKVGQYVTVTMFDQNRGFVSLISEIDLAELVATEPIKIEAGGESLHDLLDDLLGEINKMIINTPAGPGTLSPTNQSKISEFQTRLAKILQ